MKKNDEKIIIMFDFLPRDSITINFILRELKQVVFFYIFRHRHSQN